MEKYLFDLDGKIAAVSGAASGLGRAMALALAKAGAEVIIADLDQDQSRASIDDIIKTGHKPLFCKVDVTRRVDIQSMVDFSVSEFGRLDIFVNSAGVTIMGKPMIDMSEDDWDRIIDINLKGTFLSNQTVARQMIKQKSGRIINIASMSSVIVNRNPYGSSGIYCASKAGVVMLTRAFAADLAKHNITVNAISPGFMRTAMVDEAWKNDPQGYAAKMDAVPMGTPGEPSDLEGLVVYLASDNSRYMTGANLIIDGGYSVW